MLRWINKEQLNSLTAFLFLKDDMEIYHANIVYSKSSKELVELTNAYIVVKEGVIQDIYNELPNEYKNNKVIDFGNGVIIPAFSDLHVHAPQYPNRGLAMDK